MENQVTLTHPRILKRTKFSDMDGLIKLMEAILLAGMPFLVTKPMSFCLLSVSILMVTFISRINTRTLLMSAISYCIVFLFPYLFGIGMNALLYAVSGNAAFESHQGYDEIFLRLFRLFMIWYVSILYFHTTEMKTVIGLLDKLLTPLKFFGVPVSDYLKVVMCIVKELTEMGSDVKKSLGESMRSAIGGGNWKFHINIKGISQIIVSLIVNSFEKLDKIESFVEKSTADDLYSYRFKLSIHEVVSILSFFLLVSLVVMIEKGYWF